MNTPLAKEQVQHTLNQIGYQRPFVVIFQKVNGEQRKMVCMMDAPKDNTKKNTNAVPVMEIESGQWKSFKLDSVLFISDNI